MKTLRLSGPPSNNSRPCEGPCSRGERLLHTPCFAVCRGGGGACFGTLFPVCTGHSTLKFWNHELQGGWWEEGRPPPSLCSWWGSADLGDALEGSNQGEGSDGGYGSRGAEDRGGWWGEEKEVAVVAGWQVAQGADLGVKVGCSQR